MVLLCSPQYIKTNLIADSNIDDALITTAIQDAQEIDVRMLIGGEFLDDLKNKVASSTLNGDEASLIALYLRPVIARYSLYYLSMLLNNRLTARGVVQKESDSSSVIDENALNRFREESKNYADYYAKRLIDYLNSNTSKFPLYKCGRSPYGISWSLSGYQKEK